MLERLSRSLLLRVIEMANRCLAVSTLPDLEALVTALGAMLPFRKAALCAVAAGKEGPSLRHVVNHSFGEQWGSLYSRREFQRVDPVVGHARTRIGAFTWSDAFRRGATSSSATFIEAARDFGLVDGVTFSCTSHPSSSLRTLLSLSGLDAAGTARALQVLTVLGPHLHEAYRRLLSETAELTVAQPLSDREREILNWTKDGKTYWEIGCIVGISQRTVKYHFSNIKSKLDVVTRCHAVAKAMRLGLIA